MQVKLNKGLVLVKVPKLATLGMVKNFLEEHKEWVYKNYIKQIEQEKLIKNIWPNNLSEGSSLPYNGGRQFILYSLNEDFQQDEIKICRMANLLLVYLPKQGSSLSKAYVAGCVKKFLRDELYAKLQRIIKSYDNIAIPKGITIKEQSTIWGSCGSKNVLHFNFALAFVPLQIVKYVVIHEMCHIQHRNHSKSFWRLVGKHHPAYLQSDKWLRNNTWALEYTRSFTKRAREDSNL